MKIAIVIVIIVLVTVVKMVLISLLHRAPTKAVRSSKYRPRREISNYTFTDCVLQRLSDNLKKKKVLFKSKDDTGFQTKET